MEVKDGLPRAFTVVDDNAVAAVGDSKFAADFVGYQQEMAEDLLVFGSRIHEARDRTLGNHQEVHRCLGRSIGKGQTRLILVQHRHGEFATQDARKDIGVVVVQEIVFLDEIWASRSLTTKTVIAIALGSSPAGRSRHRHFPASPSASVNVPQ